MLAVRPRAAAAEVVCLATRCSVVVRFGLVIRAWCDVGVRCFGGATRGPLRREILRKYWPAVRGKPNSAGAEFWRRAARGVILEREHMNHLTTSSIPEDAAVPNRLEMQVATETLRIRKESTSGDQYGRWRLTTKTRDRSVCSLPRDKRMQLFTPSLALVQYRRVLRAAVCYVQGSWAARTVRIVIVCIAVLTSHRLIRA